MTTQEWLDTIKSLPTEQQFELANSILDGLAQSGELPVSDEVKHLLEVRGRSACPDRSVRRKRRNSPRSFIETCDSAA